MAIPEQVRLAGERANELLNQANGTTPPADAPAPAPDAVPLAPADQPVDTPAPAPAPAPDPTPAPAPAPAPEPDWMHKYKTLQGVLAAEQGRWNAEKKVLTDRLTALEAQATAAPAPAPAAPAPAAQPKITDKDLETYGPELLDVIGRKAAEIAEQMVAQQMAQLKPQLDQTRAQVTTVANTVAQTAEQKFYGQLTEAVADWREVNENPKWLDWLAEVDPMFGVPRQAALNNAQEHMDHVRVANLFNAFKEAAGLNKPAPAPAAPARPAVSPSPRTVGNASAPAMREPQSGVKRSEITAHYARAARDPAYRQSQEYKDAESRLGQAMATGQIIEE